MLTESGQAIQAVLAGVWQLFDLQIPGTAMTVKSFVLGVFIVSLGVLFLRFCFGFGDPHILGYRSRQSSSVKVSDARRGDEK